MKNPREYPETHRQGAISIENVPTELANNTGNVTPGIMKGDFGIQIAQDGQVWICINGIAFLRFSPHPDGRMNKERR